MDADRLPALNREAFCCPHSRCGVYADQFWADMYRRTKNGQTFNVAGFSVSICRACGEPAVWEGERMVYPLIRLGEEPHPDMPDDVLDIYDEAREVASMSRKSAAGLLRLALQMLVDDLEPGSGTIDQKIGRLVQKGLDPQVQQAMDVLRVVGNEAVHPGQIDLDADDDLLPALFNLANIIVEQIVARPKHIGGLFAKLPPEKIAGIERRDAPTE